MPLIDLETSTGPGSFRYTLSTPADANAEAIVQGTPTLVLIHPIALGCCCSHVSGKNEKHATVYFNLLTLDLRGHGSTSATVDPHTYGRETAAKDVLHLMVCTAYSLFKVLIRPEKLPASHLMGVSRGSCIALQMAIFAPERVLSIYIFSPLPL
ncbi:hypothetical protein DFH08DRAFT_646243, partial [Mycena albidolilacea]